MTFEARKEQRKKDIRSLLNRHLSKTDWKITRHKEQIELGLTTSINQTDYDAILLERNDLRTLSNDLEVKIDSCVDRDELRKLDVFNTLSNNGVIVKLRNNVDTKTPLPPLAAL